MIPWNINNLLEATPLRETDPASPSSYPVTVLSQFEVALCAQPFILQFCQHAAGAIIAHSCNLSAPLPRRFLIFGSRMGDTGALYFAFYSGVSYLLHVDQEWISVLLNIYCTRDH